MVPSIYDSAAAAVSCLMCWVVRGLITSSIGALPSASWWNTAVVHARPFLVQGPQGTREYERKQPRRPSGAHSVAIIFCTSCTLAEGGINVRCCVVYQFIDIRCARFRVFF